VIATLGDYILFGVKQWLDLVLA